METLNLPPELLLMVAENLSIRDHSMFRSTSYHLWCVLNPLFKMRCLQDVGNLTALQWAAVCGHAELIKLAIRNGAEIDKPLRGQFEATTLKMEGRPNWRCDTSNSSFANDSATTEAKDSIIRTPLFLAACSGRVEAIELLLTLGASMQCYGGMMTPAHIAARRGDVDCMKAFIRANFDINARGSEDKTILHQAIPGGVEMMMYILQLEGGKKLANARTSDGSTPLHYAMRANEVANPQKRLKVELLLQHGADIYARDNRGNTPAHLAAHWGRVDCLRVLITAGFDLSTRGDAGETILHCAVRGGKEILKYLLEQEQGRRIIDVGDAHGSTPVHHALQSYRTAQTELLKLHGATAPACGLSCCRQFRFRRD